MISKIRRRLKTRRQKAPERLRPGGVTFISDIVSAGKRGTIGQSGADTHRVTARNRSLVAYSIDIRGECTGPAITYKGTPDPRIWDTDFRLEARPGRGQFGQAVRACDLVSKGSAPGQTITTRIAWHENPFCHPAPIPFSVRVTAL